MTTALVKPQDDTEVMSFYNEALKLQAFAETREITTAEDLKPAVDDLSVIAKVKKGMEGKRKEYVVPLQDQVKEINEAFKSLMAPIEIADRVTRAKVLAYQQEQQRKRQEQERINALKMEAAKAEMELKGELTESVDLVEVSPEAPKRVSTDMGIVGQRMIRKWEVIDFGLLPDRYKMENATLIGKLVRAGENEIPGVRIWEEPTLAVNTR